MEDQPEIVMPERNFSLVIWLFLGLATLVLAMVWLFIYASAPTNSNETKEVVVLSGQSVRDIAETLKNEKVIRSELLLYATLTYLYDPTNIHAGTYVFAGDDDLSTVAAKLANNEVKLNLIRITFPEGIRLREMATIASNELEKFAIDDYLTKTNGLEGYLWPDTYFVPPDYTSEDIVSLQRKTYNESIEPLKIKIADSYLSEDEVITLASIVEREASDEESMRIVSGILQNRLTLGMPLQADATIEYVLATPLNELPPGQLAAEIKTLESPYNTYKQKGLPPTPIANPGLASIKAVLEPIDSDYLYYLTDKEGNFHYAETLAEHNRNIELYLRP